MATQIQAVKAGHESSAIPLKPMLWCLVGFIATAVLIHLLVICYGRMLAARYEDFGRVYQMRPEQTPEYPAPALQVNPQVDLQRYRMRAEQDLNSYGWIDPAHGVAKIPVERAMNLLVSRGLPVRPSGQDGPTELDMQQQKAAVESAKGLDARPDRRQP